MFKKISKILFSLSLVAITALPSFAKENKSYKNQDVNIYVTSYSPKQWSDWQEIVPGLQFSYKIMGKDCITCYGFVRFKNTSDKKISFEGKMFYSPSKDSSDNTIITTTVKPGKIDQDMGAWYLGNEVKKIQIKYYNPDVSY